GRAYGMCDHQTVLSVLRLYDAFSVEALQPASSSRRPPPQTGGIGGYWHHRAKRTAGRNTSLHDAGWRHCLTPLASRTAGTGKRVEALPPRVYIAGRFELWGTDPAVARARVGRSLRTAACCWIATSTRPGRAFSAQ